MPVSVTSRSVAVPLCGIAVYNRQQADASFSSSLEHEADVNYGQVERKHLEPVGQVKWQLGLVIGRQGAVLKRLAWCTAGPLSNRCLWQTMVMFATGKAVALLLHRSSLMLLCRGRCHA